MKKIRIELEIEVKGDATFDEVEELRNTKCILADIAALITPFLTKMVTATM